MLHTLPLVLLLLALLATFAGAASLEPELQGWGAFKGLRVQEQALPVTTEIRIAGPEWKKVAKNTKWEIRDAKMETRAGVRMHSGRIPFGDKGVAFRQTVAVQDDVIQLHLEIQPLEALEAEEITFHFNLPIGQFAEGVARLTQPVTRQVAEATIPAKTPDNPEQARFLSGVAHGFEFKKGPHQLTAESPTRWPITLQDERAFKGWTYSAYFTLHQGKLDPAKPIVLDLTLRAATAIDAAPVQLALDPQGPAFPLTGFGGSFVYASESPVSAYNMQHLPLAWSRVFLPLHEWEPDGPVADKKTLEANDKPGSAIRRCLLMSQTLQQRGIPYIASTWPVPKWSLENPWDKNPHQDQRRLARDKWEAFADSLTSYLVYGKEKYHVEPDIFSFNEPDYGVTVRQTPEEHRDIIKLLGAKFAAAGLKTKLIVGDVTNPRDLAKYVDPTLADPEAMQHVAAVSFHSWDGASDEHLRQWNDAARRAERPLFVGEVGLDSQAHRFPAMFDEYWYALGEARMYQQLLLHARPQVFLFWEYSNDYSLVKVGPDKDKPTLTPSKRFWFLKQCSGLIAAPAEGLATTGSGGNVLFTAFRGKDGRLTLHVINDGPARQATITNLPVATGFDLFLTDPTHDMRKLDKVTVTREGAVEVKLPARALVTLTSVDER